MKTAHQCPKCSSNQVILLTGSSIYATVYGPRSLVERYACTDCGSIEEYLVDVKELAKLKKKLKS